MLKPVPSKRLGMGPGGGKVKPLGNNLRGSAMKSNNFWLQKIIWIYDYQTPVSILAGIALVLSILGEIWTLLEVSGVRGSPTLLIGLLLVSAISVAGFIMISHPLRWAILFRASKDYIQKYLLDELTPDKILVGIGPGGAIVIGIVAKAIRDLGRTPPSIIAFDLRYKELGDNPSIGDLWPNNYSLPSEKCWIIQGNVSSGRSLQALRDRVALHQAKVFAFVISEHVLYREKIDHFMAIGTRNILPWATEKAKGT